MSETRGQCPAHQSNTNGVSSPNVFGVAFMDADYPVKIKKELPKVNGKRRRKTVWTCPYYQRWFSMLKRCYWEGSNIAYKDVFVCEEWLKFSNFRAWMETQDWEGKHLDKDILGNGKIYSPETCCFVPQRVNLLLIDAKASRGLYPKGVTLHKGRYIARVGDGKGNLNLGSYGCRTAAALAYHRGKLEVVKEVCSNLNDERVKDALIRRFSLG